VRHNSFHGIIDAPSRSEGAGFTLDHRVADRCDFFFEFLNLDDLPPELPSTAMFFVMDIAESVLWFEADFGDFDLELFEDFAFKDLVAFERMDLLDLLDFVNLSYFTDFVVLDAFVDRLNRLDLLISIKSSSGEYGSSPSE